MRLGKSDPTSKIYLSEEAYLNNIKLIDINGGAEKALACAIVDADGELMKEFKISKNFMARSDVFNNVRAGRIIDCSLNPLQNFSLQVSGDKEPTSWNVSLEGSLDGVNFSNIATHTISFGGVVYSNLKPIFYFRANVKELILGQASEISVTIIGMQ